MTVRRLILIVGISGVVLAGVYVLSRGRKPTGAVDPVPAPSVASVGDREKVTQFCGSCHRIPSAEYFPRDAWYKEVQRGFDFYTDSGRHDLSVPKLNDVVAWYRSQAPEKLPPTGLLPATSRVDRFRPEVISSDGLVPMVSSLHWDAQAGTWPSLRFSDMEAGQIAGIERNPTAHAVVVATGRHVAGTKIVDVDRDGQLDMLICELGSKLPGDHALGRLSYLPASSADKHPIALLEHVGRVADASVADFDGDGDLDLVVAEFGWLKTGSILVLENKRPSEARGKVLSTADFVPHPIDQRHGTIHVHVTDINHDRRPDFVALISQEFETVEAFINEGGFQFRREVIMEPRDPAFGSCGIELADIDHDGDDDIVYCNGDTLDSHLVKPYHGVHWLVNEGRFPYTSRQILSLPGASDSAVADFDGDGDLDIAVSAYLPGPLLSQLPTGTYDSLCWLEQLESHEFRPHAIEVGTVGHLGLTAGDFDGNGTVDIAVGDSPGQGWGKLWWNERRK